MSAPAFTPGPWQWHECFDPTGRRLVSRDIVAVGGHSLSGVAVVASIFGPVEDARLIAAAPELYQALENTLTIAKLKWGDLDEDVNVIFRQAAAALAKARGAA